MGSISNVAPPCGVPLQTLQSLPVTGHCMNIHEPLKAMGPLAV